MSNRTVNLNVVQRHITDNFPWLVLGVFVSLLAGGVYNLWRRKVRGPHFPNHDSVHILFDESWVSGNSFKSLLTRLGGARNCLRVTVTPNELWVTVLFPFSAYLTQFDLDHRVRRATITNVQQRGKAVHIKFMLDDRDSRTIALYVRETDRLLEALRTVAPDGRV